MSCDQVEERWQPGPVAGGGGAALGSVGAEVGAMAGPQSRATPQLSTPLPGAGDRAGKHHCCKPLGSSRPWRVGRAPQDGRLQGQGCQAGLAAVCLAAGCGDLAGRWRRDEPWRIFAYRAGAGGWGVAGGVTAGAGGDLE